MQLLSVLAAGIICFFTCTSSYYLASDCNPYAAQVKAAVSEAHDIAIFAQTKTQQNPAITPGTLLGDMLGTNGENDREMLNIVTGHFKNAVNTMESPNVAIHCNDAHLENVKSDGKPAWRDTEAEQTYDWPFDSSTACGLGLAFTLHRSSGASIVLCSRAETGVLYVDKGFPINSWNGPGFPGMPSVGLDQLKIYLTQTVLHEFMHASNGVQFGSNEFYGYANIMKASAENRQHNADSYAFLGCGWFTNKYYWQNGSAEIDPEWHITARPSTAGLEPLARPPPKDVDGDIQMGTNKRYEPLF